MYVFTTICKADLKVCLKSHTHQNWQNQVTATLQYREGKVSTNILYITITNVTSIVKVQESTELRKKSQATENRLRVKLFQKVLIFKHCPEILHSLIAGGTESAAAQHHHLTTKTYHKMMYNELFQTSISCQPFSSCIDSSKTHQSLVVIKTRSKGSDNLLPVWVDLSGKMYPLHNILTLHTKCVGRVHSLSMHWRAVLLTAYYNIYTTAV